MAEIKRLHPTLSFDHLRTLTSIVVVERNAVAVVTKIYKTAAWGSRASPARWSRIESNSSTRPRSIRGSATSGSRGWGTRSWSAASL